FCCVFFFQAEDGIRDFHVTGVQTCALPICSYRRSCCMASVWREPAQLARAQSVLVTLARDCICSDSPGQARSRAPCARIRCWSKIGRASCRERVESWGEGESSKKKERVHRR